MQTPDPGYKFVSGMLRSVLGCRKVMLLTVPSSHEPAEICE